jgi:hypothetical protein
VGKDLVGSGRGLIKVLIMVMPAIRVEGLRKTTKTHNQHSQSLGPRFEPGTSRIQSRNVNHSTATFGCKHRIVFNFIFVSSVSLLTTVSVWITRLFRCYILSSLHGLGESPVPASNIVVSLSVFLIYLCLVFRMVDIYMPVVLHLNFIIFVQSHAA